jgi:GrpB-like predicted nucleotidyltransferase (UPF0157 family)
MRDVRHDGSKWSNSEEDRIEISGYDPGWSAEYETESNKISAELGSNLLLEIHHIGSTAIPGMAAKPIIDILLIVHEWSERARVIQALQKLGYVYWAENPEPGRMFFVKGMPPFGARRTHHVHVFDDVAGRKRRIFFRDYLRLHADTAREYMELKRRLAEQFSNDRDAYTRGKDEFIGRICAGMKN